MYFVNWNVLNINQCFKEETQIYSWIQQTFSKWNAGMELFQTVNC